MSESLTQIGKYQLTDLLGQGAMGVVYRALDPLLNRYVAIKLMGQSITSDQLLRDRFMREAQAAGSLQHPNIITIYDFGDFEGHLYIAMEFVAGADLSELIERKEQIPLPAKLDIMIDVLQALNYAHERKIIHRDIKPANIRVSTDGRAKLMDFGIARLESSEMTKSGMLIGTPNYMAPEQVTSGNVTPATDIFALGVVLYEFLTYRRTFEGDTLHAVLFKIVSEQPPPLDAVAHGVPEPLKLIVEKALAKEPSKRFATAGDMARELTSVRTVLSAGKPVTITTRMTPLATAVPALERARRTSQWLRIAAAAVLVLAVGSGVMMLLRGKKSPERPAEAPAPASQPTNLAAGNPAPLATLPSAPAPAAQTPAREPRAATPSAAPTAAAARSAPPQPAPSTTASSAQPVTQQPPSTPAPAATNPVAPPAAAPTPTQTAPAPVTAAPAAPAEDPRADIEQLLAAYARAIESRSIAEIRRVYPGLTGQQQQGWEQFFQSMRSIRARLSVSQLSVSGSTAELSVSGSYDYDAGSGPQHQPVTFRATAAEDGGTWKFRTIR